MSMTDGEEEVPPVVEPKLCNFLKERNRLIDIGFREEFWDEFGDRIRQRRRPDNIADKAVSSMFRNTEETVRPVARNRARERFKDVAPVVGNET